MKPVILLDVDGVIADFKALYVECCNEANDTNFTSDHIHGTFDYALTLGLTPEQSKKTWNLLNAPDAALRIPELPGARAAVCHLSSLGDVYFVTAAPYSSPTWCHDRKEWLKKLFGEELAKKTIFTDQKHRVSGHVFVDDREDLVRRWWDEERTRRVLSLGVHWAPADEQAAGVRYNDWECLFTDVEGLAKVLRG